MPALPQSVEKSRARRVFGEFIADGVADEGDTGRSLSYSTSSSNPSNLLVKDESFSLSKGERLSTQTRNTDPSVKVARKLMLQEVEDKENVSNEYISSELSSQSMLPSKHKIRDMPPKVIHLTSNGKLDKQTTINATKKARTQKSVTSFSDLSKKQPHRDISFKSRTKRNDLIKITQRAITQATASVNNTLNAAKKAKKLNAQGKTREISRFRDEWREENEEARKYQEEAESIRRGLLNLQRQLSSKFQQTRARAKEAERAANRDQLTKESEFQSKVYRDQHRALKEERDRKRRESNMARAKLRYNHRKGEQKLRTIKFNEHLAIMEERNEGYNASSKFKEEKLNKRRKSYAFRSGDARRIREIYDRMKAEEVQREHDSYQLKFAGNRDADEHKRKLEEERRKSFAFRNKEARSQRKRQENFEKESQRQEQESITLELAAKRDADNHRRKMTEARRKSLAQRNKYAKKQRDKQYEDEMKAKAAQHESYELKWAGEKDAEEYRRKKAKDRRDSLAFRNKESFQHSKVMEELRCLEKEREAESYVLKWAGERDAKEYEARLREERRISLEGRNKEGRRHRKIEEEQKNEDLNRMAQDETLRAADHKETENYKKELAARDRASLLYRRKEARLGRLEEKLQKQKDYEIDQSNRKLVDAANWDVVEYIEDCKKRKRMSLALRAKEKRRHRNWQQKQSEKEYLERRNDSRLRCQDRRYQEIALREERRRIALDALKHAGCSFNVNAFAALLDR